MAFIVGIFAVCLVSIIAMSWKEIIDFFKSRKQNKKLH